MIFIEKKPTNQKKTKSIRSLLINPDTGEREGFIYDGDTILRTESRDLLNQTLKFAVGKKYIKVFKDTMHALADENLTGNQWKILWTLAGNFRYNSGLAAYDNGVALTVDDISRLSGVDKISTYQILEILTRKGIIAKNRTDRPVRFFINPYVFTQGSRINKTLYAMFYGSKWQKLFESQKVKFLD